MNSRYWRHSNEQSKAKSLPSWCLPSSSGRSERAGSESHMQGSILPKQGLGSGEPVAVGCKGQVLHGPQLSGLDRILKVLISTII